MKHQPLHTSDPLRADRLWLLMGGRIEPVRRTGERFYLHDMFAHPLRTNARRNDVPAKLLSRINQLLKANPANDEVWSKGLSGRDLPHGSICKPDRPNVSNCCEHLFFAVPDGSVTA
ncbi:hypothetical protein [Roseateles sp. BYS87W]|uniref:Uncharacterized protein n=1 Tax=Pelomonas baiyunensis TaxID=3299026 RepID=A0ABW7GSR6_9BURK